ncbi:MAG: hypothetical protein WCW04_02040 [Candidatus Paceibacterota bacterium]|jgi:predicted transporter
MNNKNKKVNKIFLENSFNEMLRTRNNLNSLYKEATIFFIGAFMFLCGFLFNLSASIIYDLIKNNKKLNILILATTVISLFIFIFLIKKYITRPIKETEEQLEKHKLEVHSCINKVADNF